MTAASAEPGPGLEFTADLTIQKSPCRAYPEKKEE